MCQKRALEVGGPLQTDETGRFFATNSMGEWLGWQACALFFLRRSMSISNFQNINLENTRCLMIFDMDSNLRARKKKRHERFFEEHP